MKYSELKLGSRQKWCKTFSSWKNYAYINQDSHSNLVMYVQLIMELRRQLTKARKYIIWKYERIQTANQNLEIYEVPLQTMHDPPPPPYIEGVGFINLTWNIMLFSILCVFIIFSFFLLFSSLVIFYFLFIFFYSFICWYQLVCYHCKHINGGSTNILHYFIICILYCTFVLCLYYFLVPNIKKE